MPGTPDQRSEMQAIADRDPNGALFERLRPRLKAISRRIVGSDAEADDVVQDCFLKWQATRPAALATPAAWLTTVVQHLSIDRLRRRVREAAAARTAMELAPETAPALPDAGLVRRADLAAALARMLTRLTPAERLALVLHEAFDCSHADIAAALGTNAVNARQYLARARRRLRERRKNVDYAENEEKRCRELVRRFQAALDGGDLPAMMALLTDEQPVSVRESASASASASANDACYLALLAA